MKLILGIKMKSLDLLFIDNISTLKTWISVFCVHPQILEKVAFRWSQSCYWKMSIYIDKSVKFQPFKHQCHKVFK